jgi:Myb-like DNA-binding protein FlbD
MYPSASRPHIHHEEQAPQHMQHHLPPPMSRESTEYYSQSRRPSLNPSNSPHTLQLPHPRAYEPQFGSRPQALELQPYSSHPAVRGRAFETPMPSPSGYSIVSADGAPSLITDTGSESRSPRGAASPVDISLAPLVGSREERKNSCTRWLPRSGFAIEDDDHSAPYEPYRRRASVQLPPLHRAESAVPAFREPSYRAEYRLERPQLLTQPAPQHMHHHSLPLSAPLPTSQKPLPAFHTLAEPGQVPISSASALTTSPATRQLPSPFARPQQASESRSAPVSPRHEAMRDSRMNLSNIC